MPDTNVAASYLFRVIVDAHTKRVARLDALDRNVVESLRVT